MAGERTRAEERFYAALLDDDAEELYEHAPCGYLSALADGTIIKVNHTFLAWTGYDLTDLVATRRFQDLLAPGDRIFYEAHVAPMLQLSGHAREVAVELELRSGDRLPVLVNLVTAHADGREPLIRAAVFDATERRAYERELVAAVRRAEELEAKASALARTLQSTFLPPELPAIPGLDVGGAYRPAGDGTEVGGDFYDLFPTGTASWAAALGDVCGKGAAAAVLTALARQTMRAVAMHERSPSAVLVDLHRAFLRYHPDTFCTALFVALLPSASGAQLVVASGGHQLPLCRRADGRWERLGRRGPLVGMVDLGARVDAVDALGPGDVLVLCTDGVTEARSADGFFGEDRLRDAIEALHGSAAQVVADGIVDVALSFQDGNARDDMAVLVVTVSER